MAVPVTVVPVVSWVMVKVFTTGVPPPCAPAGACVPATPRLVFPDTWQPFAAIPDKTSLHVNVAVTLLVYQPFVPSVPVSTTETVGGVRSIRTGPNEVVA